MHTRVPCNRCRERLLVTPNTATIRCPRCLFENKIVTFQGLKTEDEDRISPIARFVAMIKTTISCYSNGSPSYESLNCKPSPLVGLNSSSNARPTKRALLIGVTYKGKYKLKGTIIDVKSMRDLLINNFHFRQEDILVLTEKESEPELVPTKKNIQNSMKWLVMDCQAGDSLVFYFSGHGVRQPDFEDDESDGYDENICPSDFMQEGLISDDDIYTSIISTLKKDVTLNSIIDACHSGTVLDLLYVYNRDEKEWKKSINSSSRRKEAIDGLAISICACEDEQVAADTTLEEFNPVLCSLLTQKNMQPCMGMSSTMNGGAMTCILTNIVTKNHGITYGKLLDSIHDSMEVANKECLPERILKRLFNNMLLQRPQLSASEKFDIYKTPFLSTDTRRFTSYGNESD